MTRTASALLVLALAVCPAVRADSGSAARLDEFARAVTGGVARVLLGRRDALAARPARGFAPAGPELPPLLSPLGRSPSALACFLPDGSPLWSLGPTLTPPGDWPGDTLRLRAVDAARGAEAEAWLPPAAGAPGHSHRFAARLDVSALLRASLPTNGLDRSSRLLVLRREDASVLAFAPAAPVADLADPARLRARPRLRQVLDTIRAGEAGVAAYPRFDAASGTALVLARVEWRSLDLHGLPVCLALETESPFAPEPGGVTGSWQRGDAAGAEAFDLLEDGGAWQVRGTGPWTGFAAEGRVVDGVYSTARMASDTGLPGLVSFALQQPEPAVLRTVVYQRQDGVPRHFVFQFRRAGAPLFPPGDRIPLKIQLR